MKTAVYSSLTMPQRLRALVCAFGRADHEELERLADSSPDGGGTIQKVKHHFRNLSQLAAIHNVWLLDPCANRLFSKRGGSRQLRRPCVGGHRANPQSIHS